MGTDDGGADGKADAHAVTAVIRWGGAAVKLAGEQHGKLLPGDAAAVVCYFENGLIALCADGEGQGSHARGMENGVFQQIDQYLLDQHGIHGDADKILRDRYIDLPVRIVLAEFQQHGVDQLLQHRVGLADKNGLVIHPGDREQILHHPHQAFRVLPHFAQEPQLLLFGNGIVIVDDGGAGAVDGSQRCAQVMRDGSQQIAPHLFGFGFQLHPLLGLQLGGQGAGGDGDRQHDQGGNEIVRRNEVEGKIGEGEDKIVDQHAAQAGKNTPQVASGQHGDQKHRQNEYQRNQ